jgi:protoporphyrinogen IX oxidase
MLEYMHTPYRWVAAVHVFGFVFWVGSMTWLMYLLRVHARAKDESRGTLTEVEKLTSVVMDAGATLAIVTGLLMAFGSTYKWFSTPGSGWLHSKLTIVVALIVIHVVLRIKVRKFAQGTINPLPGFMFAVLAVLAFAAIALAKVKPF